MMKKNRESGMPTKELATDLMCGAEAIAKFLGWPVRRVFYACEKQHIPAFKIVNKWCARKSTLAAHIEMLEKKWRAV
jgi:hypothetical protein